MPETANATRRRGSPPVELLTRGRFSPAECVVRYVDEDASGDLRLIVTIPEVPARA